MENYTKELWSLVSLQLNNWKQVSWTWAADETELKQRLDDKYDITENGRDQNLPDEVKTSRKMIKNEIAEPAVELAECIEEQLESSSEDLGEIEADPDKETFDHKNEDSDYESDSPGLTSSTPPSPAACMDKIKEESIHSEADEDEELVNSDTEDPRTLDDVNDITDKERVEIITSIKSGDLSPVVC